MAFWLRGGPEELIDDINAWRLANIGSIAAHDMMHLFSGLDFDGGTIGLASQYASFGQSACLRAVKILLTTAPGSVAG